jgi:hypothetical protein
MKTNEQGDLCDEEGFYDYGTLPSDLVQEHEQLLTYGAPDEPQLRRGIRAPGEDAPTPEMVARFEKNRREQRLRLRTRRTCTRRAPRRSRSRARRSRRVTRVTPAAGDPPAPPADPAPTSSPPAEAR